MTDIHKFDFPVIAKGEDFANALYNSNKYLLILSDLFPFLQS